MSKVVRLPKFWVLAAGQVVLIVGTAAVWFCFRTVAYLAEPPDPDTYAWSWGFQLMVFVVVWLPAILLCVGVLLAIERIALGPCYRAATLRGDRHEG